MILQNFNVVQKTEAHFMKTKLNIIYALCLLLITGSAVESSAQSIVRLFFTPAERAELERQRLRGSRPEEISVLPEIPLQLVELPISLEDEEIVEVVYRVGGTMSRSDGRYTVWINDAAIYQEDLPTNIELLRPYSQGQLLISNEESGQSFNVKPGQVLNLTTGVLVESYQYVAPAPISEAPEQTEDAVAQMTDIIDGIGSENRERLTESDSEMDAASTNRTPGASANATQLIDQARDIQDSIQ